MAIHDDEIAMVKRALPEILGMARAGVEVQGMGFPTSILLFAVIDVIGSYHKDDPALKVLVDGVEVGIGGTNDHFRILNSKYFGEPHGLGLTGGEINRLYALARSRVTHNALLGEGIGLAEGEPTRPAIKQAGGYIWVYLPALLEECEKAARRFMAVADQVIPGSAVIRELREKEATQGVNYEDAIASLRNLPHTESISCTAMARPDSTFGNPRAR